MQAFRRRQRGDEGSGRSQESKVKIAQFVVEKSAQLGAQGRVPNALSPAKGQEAENAGSNDDGTQPSFSVWESGVRYPNDSSDGLNTLHNHLLRPRLPQEISTAQVSRQQLASTAVYAFCPTIQDQSLAPHWSQTVPDLVNRNVVLDFTVQALCFMQISRVNQERWLLQESLRFYNRALKALQEALPKAKDHFRLEIFAAMMGLSTYELLQGANAQGPGRLFHIEGATAYLEMFPTLDLGAFNHQLSFHFLETICIFDALGSRRPSRLSSSQWWKNSVDKFGGETYGALLRMLTSLPGVLEQCDTIVSLSVGNGTVEQRTKLLRLCLRFEEAFQAWYRQLACGGSTRSSSCTTPDTVELIYYGPMQTLDAEAPFADLETARLYLLYWSAMILLYGSIASLISNLQTSPSTEMATTPGHSADAMVFPEAYTNTSHNFATSISNAVSFCLRPSFGITGESLVLLPLSVASNKFRQAGDEDNLAKCEEIYQRLAKGR